MQIILGESETTFGSKLQEELGDRADVACWGLQHVSFFQKLVHTHAVCFCLSRMKNDHDQGFSQVQIEKGWKGHLGKHRSLIPDSHSGLP